MGINFKLNTIREELEMSQTARLFFFNSSVLIAMMLIKRSEEFQGWMSPYPTVVIVVNAQ